MADEHIEMTQRAEELYKFGSDGIELSAKGKSAVRFSAILETAAKNQGMIPQSLFVLTQAVADREETDKEFESCGIMDTYMGFAVHRGAQVKENEKGFPVLFEQKDENGNTIKIKVRTYFDMTQTKDWQAVREEPSEESLGLHGSDKIDYINHDKMWEDVYAVFDKHEDNPIIGQMAQYIVEEYCGIRLGIVDPYENGYAYIDRLDNDIVNACKDKSQDEILSMLQTALDDSSEAISIMTEYAEHDIEGEVFQRADVFGVPVLFEDTDLIPGKYDSLADRPMNMFVYELFDKDGKNYIAHETPRGGDLNGYVFTADAIPGGYEGLCVGDTFHVIGCEKLKDFRKEYAASPVSKTGFYHNNEIVAANEPIVMQKPDKNLRVFGVYNTIGEMIGGGYLEKNEVPHTNEEILDFIKNHDLSILATKVIFNCEGQAYGLGLDFEITSNEFSRVETRTVIVEPEELVKNFMLAHGVEGDIETRSRRENAEVGAVMSDSEPRKTSIWDAVRDKQPKTEKSGKSHVQSQSGPSHDD